MQKIKLTNGKLVTEDGVVRKDIVINGDRIDLAGKASTDETIDIAGKYIVPGFIDIHFHGYNLFDFTLGKFDPAAKKFNNSEEAFSDGFAMLSETLPQFGVTSFYVSSFAASVETLHRCYSLLAKYMDSQDITSSARLIGGMLEGSFISPEMAGAQNPEYLLDFSIDEFEKIRDRGAIKLANVVPDPGEDAYVLTKYLTDKGIIVGAGHTNATADQVKKAEQAGLKYCIHFTNGPTGGSYKPFNGGGAIEAVLRSKNMYAELIADGRHVAPVYIRDIIKRKGVDRILGITDCMFFGGSDVEEIELSGLKGRISKDRSCVKIVGTENSLFGSNLTIKRGFENMLNWQCQEMEGVWNEKHPALSLEDSLVNSSKFYSTNPAKLTGLYEKGFGSIAQNRKADFAVIDVSKSQGSYKVEILMTFVNGSMVYSRDPERALV